MATRVHEVKFPGDGFWTVLTNYVQAKSMQRDELLMNSEYRACKDVYRFTIAGYTAAIHDDFYNATSEILFRCTESGTTLFTGKIDPNYRQRIGQLLGPLVLEAEDNSYLLDEPVATSFAYPTLVGGAALKIFDSTDTGNSIIHKLLTAAGYNIAADIAGAPDIPANITTTITHVSGSKDEGTYWELIDDILHFHGYVMRWTADGKYTHENWAPAVVTSTHTFKDDLATNPALVTNKKFEDFDGVECEWCTLATRSDARLFQMNTPFNSDGTFAGESIAAGSEYPLGADTDDTYQDYREKWLDRPSAQVIAARYSSTVAVGRSRKRPGVKAIDLIASSGHSIKDDYENGITRTLTYESLRAKLYYSNPTGSTLKLWYSYIYGDALFRAMIKKTTSLFVAGATRLAQIQTRHLYNETVAQKYAIARRNTLKYGDFTYSFASKTSVYVGSIATIQYTDPATSIAFDTEVVIVGKKKSKHLPLYHYTACGVAAYSVEAVDTEGEEVTNLVFEGLRDSARATNLLPDASAYSDYDEIPQSDCEYWDLRQPDCKSHLNRSPEQGYLTSFFPGHLYDEIKTEYDNLWAKFTGLGTIGVFKATANVVADPEDLTTTTWTAAANKCTPSLSNHYWAGRRFTLLTGDAETTQDHFVTQVVTFASSAVKSYRIVLKKGSSAWTTILLWDATVSASRAEIDIDWGTASLTTDSGTVVQAHWYASNTVLELSVLSVAVIHTNINRVYLYCNRRSNTGGVNTNDNSVYATAVQAEDSTYPTPYTPTERAAAPLDFNKSMPNQGTIECWVRSWFDADTTGVPIVFGWAVDATHYLFLYYAPGTNSWYLSWMNGGTGRSLVGTTVYTNTTLWNWIHLKVTWDISAGTGSLIVNGSIEDSSWSGALDAFATPIETLGIGCRWYDGTDQFDGLITDFLFKNYVDTSTDHYTGGQPYYDPDETANQYQSVRINKAGIRMHNAGLTIMDGLNRLISISNTDGLLARDAGGQIIHDIADAPVQVGNYYMGHLYYSQDTANHVILNTAAPAITTWTDVTCLDDENNNVRGGLFSAWIIAGKLTSNYSSLKTLLYLRPKGSSWGTGSGGSTPLIRSTWYSYSSHFASTISLAGLIICPLGTDNKIQYYWDPTPTGNADNVEIRQIGVFI